MNYRQWKKNYKKKHGYNPLISEDRKKRAKIEARYVYQLPEIVIDEFMPNFLKGIADACEILSNGFKNIAENFKTSADNFSRK